MTKSNPTAGKTGKIIYWITTAWLALGMLSTSIVQLIKTKDEADLMARLGYPLYFLTIIGVWKFLGVAAVAPRFLLKEWAMQAFLCDVWCNLFPYSRWRQRLALFI